MYALGGMLIGKLNVLFLYVMLRKHIWSTIAQKFLQK